MPEFDATISWYRAVIETAQQQGLELPPVGGNAMGTVIWRTQEADRAVTLKRRLLPKSKDTGQAILWGVWATDNDTHPLFLCSELTQPVPDRVSLFVRALKFWLIDRVSPQRIQELVGQPSCATSFDVESVKKQSPHVISIGDENELSFEVNQSSWKLLSRDRSLTRGQTPGGSAFNSLPLSALENLARWLSQNWKPIAYATDTRPSIIRESSVSACRAYDAGILHARRSFTDSHELESWWSRHAIRAADATLPNLFIERQEDDIVFSWDSSPSESAFFRIYSGVETSPTYLAVPQLRRLVADRLPSDNALVDRSRDIGFGYQVLQSYHSKELVSPAWLANIGFTENDCADFAIAGTSRHTVVGLLRSSRATELKLTDIQTILAELCPADFDSFAKLRSLAQGLDVQLDPREPWESGYDLARRVRDRLNLQTDDNVELDDILENLVVDQRDLSLTDVVVRGACIGNPQYRPTVIVNTACPDASGISGRRITLAHEICHLLFDRSRMRGLARFEGGAADSERMFEMRANAFAVEFLVPREVLFDANGNIFQEDDLRRLAEKRSVSYYALSAHAENVRRRMA